MEGLFDLREEIVKHLGDPEKAEIFFDDLRRSLFFDGVGVDLAYGYARSNRDQYVIFKKILKHSEALLDVLRPLVADEENSSVPRDFYTANLIRDSAWYMRRKRWQEDYLGPAGLGEASAADVGSALEELGRVLRRTGDVGVPSQNEFASQEVDDGDYVPLNYASLLVGSVQELTDVVRRAAQEVKPGRGNSSGRDPDTIRKARLTQDFVRFFVTNFNKYPPKSRGGKVHSIFVRFLYLAGLDDGDEEAENFSCYKKAIDDSKKENEPLRELSRRPKSSET